MNIVFKLTGTKMIKKLSVRFYHGNLDVSTSMEIMLMDSEWNSELQMVIGNDDLNIHLQQLKVDILKRYNIDFCKGILINKPWLQKVIKTSFMRPKSENGLITPDCEIYVSDFASFWVDNHSSGWKVSAKKFMDEPAKNQYRKFIETLKEYEAVIGEKLQLRNTAKKDFESFVDYLETELYQNSTIERMISRLKFFFNRASEMNIEVNPSYKQRIYFEKTNDIDDVYLNEKEIERIFNLNLDNDDDLDNVRDNLIISLWTGLRISDFMHKLGTENIKEGIISIKTKKTGNLVKIPVHPNIQKVLNKRFGNLPNKISSSEYNILVKKVCQLAGIDNVVYGKLFNNKTKRKEVGYYKKYLLCSSHISRKSFCTNLYGKVSNDVIMSVAGWSTEKMVLHYNKTSKDQQAKKLSSFWEL